MTAKAVRPESKALLDLIPEEHRVLGDDPRVNNGRGKPAPDIYLCALKIPHSTLPARSATIAPKECLVFEESSVPGVEASQRARMRVV